MRQLSAPGRRIAVWIATSLAVAASAGCMSVGDDGERPAPSRSADSPDAGARPDGGTGTSAEEPHALHDRTARGGTGHAHPDAKGEERANGASPSVSSSATPSPEPSTGVRPQPGRPAPPRGEPEPPSEPTRSVQLPTTAPPAQSPTPEPEPEPTKPSAQPSETPPSEVRASGMVPADGMGMRKELEASPQLGPA
ncbi:hypothetical protein ACIOJD_33435 [Streptomyces sp. NPDC088116]|uniref:hypothetical protein n=1 Tax=Streptomyces sp. NPDC088116 TaxID=3365825 RepID=UPI0038036F1A